MQRTIQPILSVSCNNIAAIGPSPGRPQLNLESIWASLFEDGFAAADLRPSTLVSVLRDEKKNHFTALTKSAGLIIQLVNKSLHPFLNDKTAAKMWSILENRF